MLKISEAKINPSTQASLCSLLELKQLKMSYRFPKDEKLKSRKLIKQLFEEGKGVSKYPIKLLYLPAENSEITKAGFAVPKRNFKLAVTRNKIKRLLREAYRLHKAEFIEKNGTNFVILFIYVGKTEMPFISLEKAVVKLLKKLCTS